MAVFPQEIIDLIVYQCTDRETLRNLLTVSRACQEQVERRLWPTSVRILDDDGVNVLRRYTGHRLRILRRVTIEQDWPVLDDWELSCRETADEVRENNEVFTRRIAAIFTAIKTLEMSLNDGSGAQDMNVSLTIMTPRQLVEDAPCDHRCYHSWRLHLLQPETIPRLESIKQLVVGLDERSNNDSRFWSFSDNRYRHALDLRVGLDLLDKLPHCHSLQSIDIHDSLPYPYEARQLKHFARPFEGPRRDSRHGFARAFRERVSSSPNLSPGAPLYPALKAVTLYLGRPNKHVDQDERLPNLVTPNPDIALTTDDVPASRLTVSVSHDDPLSSSLRLLSQNLVTSEVRGCIDKSIFWPSTTPLTSLDDTQTPFWPNLTHLSVEFDPAHPRGTWFFQAPPPFSSSSASDNEQEGFTITQEHYPSFSRSENDAYWDDVFDDLGGRYENVAVDMFRVTPVDAAVDELLEAFALALERMPALKEAELYTLLKWWPSQNAMETYFEGDRVPLKAKNEELCGLRERHGVRYCHWWGVKYNGVDSDEGKRPRLEWRVGDWRPCQRVLDMIHRAVAGSEGGDLVEEWLEA